MLPFELARDIKYIPRVCLSEGKISKYGGIVRGWWWGERERESFISLMEENQPEEIDMLASYSQLKLTAQGGQLLTRHALHRQLSKVALHVPTTGR